MKPPVSKNQIVKLCPDSVNEKGDGVSRVAGGFVIFTKGLLPGEKASARIIKVCAGYAVARAEKRENDSPSRISPACPYAEKGCGGCAFPHVSREGQLQISRRRVVDCLARIGHVTDADNIVSCCADPGDNLFRNKTVYPFFEVDGAVRTGFYARASHRPVPFEKGKRCPHENPVSASIREKIGELAARLGYSAYDETNGKGLLRHLTVRLSDSGNDVRAMVILTVNAPEIPSESVFADELVSACPQIDSLYLGVNTAPGNAVFAGSYRLLRGIPLLECRIETARFRISPSSFFQVSTAGAKVLYDLVYEAASLRGGERVYDLYCGAGTIGLYLLKRFSEENPGSEKPGLTGIEIVPEAVENARENALINGIESAEFIAGDVPAEIGKIGRGRPDVVIIDPPRKGTTPELIRAMLDSGPDRIVYVSCDPSTLARDLNMLLNGGQYALRSAKPVFMFPDTGHVETVVLLTLKTQK